MRRVAYRFINESYVAVLKSFCDAEGLIAVDLNQVKDNLNNYVFYITDSESHIQSAPSASIPSCLITSTERNSLKYYVLNEKLSVYGLRMLLDRIHHGGTLWNTVSGVSHLTATKEFNIGNCISDIERVVCLLTRDFVFYCTFSEVEKVRIGFSEMLANAIEHGNLNITNKEKFDATEDGSYQDLLKVREQDKRYKDRKVYSRIEFSPEKVVITIRDEGEGFDISTLPSPKDDDQLMRLHGRGILITRAYFDSLEYSSKGNEVVFTKFFKKS